MLRAWGCSTVSVEAHPPGREAASRRFEAGTFLIRVELKNPTLEHAFRLAFDPVHLASM
jgi:hypothetical protein